MKLGDMMVNCTLLTKELHTFNKAMPATWDEFGKSEFKEDSEKEEAILCFMVIE